MNNNYKKFNSWALQYYRDRNSIYGIGTLAIEVTEIENYCKENEIIDLKFREIIEIDWSNLLHFKYDDIPQYFGLIALQCYAASKMQYDDNAGVNNFQTRFLEISGITDQQDLQLKFKSEYFGIPVQEKIWIDAKDYLSMLDIEINIPEQSMGAGRYVQYPKTQVILNQEDLKEYFDLFNKVEEVFEVISFNEFKKYFKNNIDKYQFNRRNNLINNRSENENNIKLKQIFDFYCSENWRDFKRLTTIYKEKKQTINYILLYDEFAKNKIKLFNEESIEIYFSKSLFEKNPLKGIIFFKKSEEYNNEYDNKNFLEEGKEYILVTNNNFNSDLLKTIKENFEIIDFESREHSFFKGKIEKNKIPKDFFEMIKETYPIEIVGIKISQKKQYLLNFPPVIINSKNVNYRINPEYNPHDTKIGKYQIRVPGFSNLNFEIIENPHLKSIVHSRNIGLQLIDLNIVENDYDVQGFEYLGSIGFQEENLNINNWIKIQTRKTKIETSNIILKALIQSKHGK